MSVLDQFRLDGQTVIVTGGNRGIGQAIADAMADVGANVVIANRDGPTGRATAEALADEYDVETRWIQTDVSDEASVVSTVEETVDAFGTIDVLVNNAGVNSHYDVAEMPLEEWQWLFDINITGLFLCTKYVGQEMIDSGGGNIVNIASISGIIANYPQKQAHYNASKAAVDGFMRQLASDWAEHDIRVNNINPGYITTAMVEDYLENHPELEETWKSQMPGDQFAGPEVIAPLAVYLASDASEYVTGERVIIDGGYTVR
ncbi:short-chain dehydrogenase [Halobacteriales archaeon QS_1_68_17]|nr:MAG: short-chain dehydrogenase [Halobacteriales archaeon QS_1_68_17]